MSKFYTLCTIIIGIVLAAFISYRSCLIPEADNWGYKPGQSFKDPSQWKDLPGSRSCAAKRQSPIDISSGIIEYWSALKSIKLTHEPGTSGQVRMKKESHSIKIDFNNKWKITFGGQGCLKPLHIHWHWGSDNNKGSEHIKNGKAFPAEGHLVSYNCEIYNSTAAAVAGPSGLYVIGFFYQIGPDNKALSQLQKPMEHLKTAPYVSVDEIRPLDFLPFDLSKYYRYEGSLTTPPCTENVIWTVLEEEATIGKSQLELFRSFSFSAPESGPMVDNFRPVIQISDSADYVRRVVYSSFSASSTVLKNAMFISFSMVLCSYWVSLV